MLFNTIMIKKQRIVHLSDVNKSTYGGGHYKTYGYTNKDLALLFDCSIDYVRHLICNKTIDPKSIESICKHYMKMMGRRD